MNLASPWLVTFDAKPAADLRLFCFPYAGGSPSVFYQWVRQLDPSIELSGIQLPGRGQRIKQPAYTHWKPLVTALASALVYHLDRPFIFFGHSMGALLAFELSRYLQRKGQPMPETLYLSGCSGPETPRLVPLLGNLPDKQFIEQVDRYYGAIPEILLKNDELMRLVLPTLRADFQVCESYQYSDGPPLSCPIVALGGADDAIAHEASMAEWGRYSSAEFKHITYPGGHFFLDDNRDAILSTLQAQPLPA